MIDKLREAFPKVEWQNTKVKIREEGWVFKDGDRKLRICVRNFFNSKKSGIRIKSGKTKDTLSKITVPIDKVVQGVHAALIAARINCEERKKNNENYLEGIKEIRG